MVRNVKFPAQKTLTLYVLSEKIIFTSNPPIMFETNLLEYKEKPIKDRDLKERLRSIAGILYRELNNRI